MKDITQSRVAKFFKSPILFSFTLLTVGLLGVGLIVECVRPNYIPPDVVKEC